MCNSCTCSTTSAATDATLAPAESSSSSSYVVAGMTCAHCEAAVTREVIQVAGVSSVDIDLGAKLVVVRGSRVDDAAVRAAIDQAGYEVVSS